MIKNKKFKHKITGEITEQINILEINQYEELKEEEELQE